MRGTSLIVLMWNKWQLSRRCLDTLLATDLDETEIIAVDNGSEDETTTMLTTYADRVRIIQLPENQGFVRGMNAGIAAALAENDVVLLNNDLVFTQRDWLNRLRDAAYAAPHHGIVSCRMRGPEAEGRIYHTGSFVVTEELLTHQTETGLQERDIGQCTTRIRTVQYASFAVAYIRRDCLVRIGALNEDFHSYFEDPDYCLRAAENGIATVVTHAVTLEHHQGGSTSDDLGFRQRLWDNSRVVFAKHWQKTLDDHYRGTLLWSGFSRLPFVYAYLTHALLRRLEAGAFRTAYQSLSEELPNFQDFRLQLAAQRSLPSFPDISLFCAPGNYLFRQNARFKTALLFSDWQRLPAQWIKQANQLDLILVPDKFQRDAFQSSGLRTPIAILPMGADHDYFHTKVRSVPHPKGHFVFLSIVESFVRDAPDVLVKAFRRTFSSQEPVELLLYLRPTLETSLIESELRSILLSTPGARVRILNWSFPHHQIAQLMAASSVYISARRGGGWDPALAEAIACGCAVIATDFGSQAEAVRHSGYLVDVKEWISDPAQPGSYWADPDDDSFSLQLRTVYESHSTRIPQARKQTENTAGINELDENANQLIDILTQKSGLSHTSSKSFSMRLSKPTYRASGQMVVLGMHRSGTSSIAGLLALLGVWPGIPDMLMRAHDNPKGHYEHLGLHMACVRRLEATEGDWKIPSSKENPAAVDRFRREVSSVLNTLEARRPWFIKEPRLCLLIRELLPLLTRPAFVIIKRNPVEVAASLAARNELSYEHALALWEKYTIDAFAASIGYHRILIDYAEVLSDPVNTADYLFHELSRFGIKGLQPNFHLAEDWIEARLQHHRVTRLDSLIQLTPAQEALQNALTDRSILDDTQARPLSSSSQQLLETLSESSLLNPVTSQYPFVASPELLAQMYRDLNPHLYNGAV